MVMNRLKELRKKKNLSQIEMAKIVNMSQTGYSQYERNVRNISIETLKKFAIFFNTSIDYILGISDINKPYRTSSVINTKELHRLKEIREDKDLLQDDIAKLLNMSKKGYSHYETNYSEISNKKLIKLAKFYQTSTDYLLYMTDERETYK